MQSQFIFQWQYRPKIPRSKWMNVPEGTKPRLKNQNTERYYYRLLTFKK